MSDGKEDFYRYEDSDYGDGAFLEEYRGEWSLVSAKESREGEIFKRWCFPQDKDRKPLKKSIPWKVKLGDSREEAVKCLKFFLECLRGVKEPEGDRMPDDDGMPFG